MPPIDPPSATSRAAAGAHTGPTVALFATCANDAMFPQAPIAATRLLERLGCRVIFPTRQTCCGQPLINSGYVEESVPIVRNFAETFGGYDYVVAPSGSCVGAVRHQHQQLADHARDPGLRRDVDAVVARTFDISEFLIDVLGVTDVGAYFPHVVTFHPTCHSLRVARLGDKPQRLLRAVRGITVRELPDADRCCGFGGTFSLKNADVSVAMASDKARHVAGTGAEYLVAGDNLCLLNIAGVLGRQQSGVRPLHLVEVLAATEADA